jgi:pimeloyl-ACP methyl ester carboxylesterase
LKLYSEIYGGGDPVICLHGFGGSLYSWRNFVEPLSKNYQLILIDLKGFGKSPKPKDSHYSPFDHAQLIYDFILKHDLEQLTLAGNSFGGGLSLLLAIMLRDRGESARLRSMVLIDPGAYPDHVPFYLRMLSVPIVNLIAYVIPGRSATKKVLKLAYYDRDKISGAQIEAYAQPLSAPGARYALVQTGKQLVPPNFSELVAKYKTIATPTLIIWGRQDRLLALESGERLHRDLQNSTLKVIEQCGHIPQEEKPEATIPLVLDFLASH